jgi:hypothetical protein
VFEGVAEAHIEAYIAYMDEHGRVGGGLCILPHRTDGCQSAWALRLGTGSALVLLSIHGHTGAYYWICWMIVRNDNHSCNVLCIGCVGHASDDVMYRIW